MKLSTAVGSRRKHYIHHLSSLWLHLPRLCHSFRGCWSCPGEYTAILLIVTVLPPSVLVATFIGLSRLLGESRRSESSASRSWVHFWHWQVNRRSGSWFVSTIWNIFVLGEAIYFHILQRIVLQDADFVWGKGSSQKAAGVGPSDPKSPGQVEPHTVHVLWEGNAFHWRRSWWGIHTPEGSPADVV